MSGSDERQRTIDARIERLRRRIKDEQQKAMEAGTAAVLKGILDLLDEEL